MIGAALELNPFQLEGPTGRKGPVRPFLPLWIPKSYREFVAPFARKETETGEPCLIIANF
jgi:hypothetical protein